MPSPLASAVMLQQQTMLLVFLASHRIRGGDQSGHGAPDNNPKLLNQAVQGRGRAGALLVIGSIQRNFRLPCQIQKMRIDFGVHFTVASPARASPTTFWNRWTGILDLAMAVQFFIVEIAMRII